MRDRRLPRRALAGGGARRSDRAGPGVVTARVPADAGMTLVELLVTMALLAVVTTVVLSLYHAFSSSAVDSRTLSVSEERLHGVMRILEADVRSADPLLVVPSSFTLDPSPPAVTSSGTAGTTPTDVIAMQESQATFSPCSNPPPATVGTVPSPFLPSPMSANLIWAYDPTNHSLTRYSYCANDSPPAWEPGIKLLDVVDPAGTMFQVHQDLTTYSGTQATTPPSTTVVNQAAPACATSLGIDVTTRSNGQAISYAVDLAVSLPNQGAVEVQAC